MDYNFAYCVMWFFSCPFLIKAVFLACLAVGMLVAMLCLVR